MKKDILQSDKYFRQRNHYVQKCRALRAHSLLWTENSMLWAEQRAVEYICGGKGEEAGRRRWKRAASGGGTSRVTMGLRTMWGSADFIPWAPRSYWRAWASLVMWSKLSFKETVLTHCGGQMTSKWLRDTFQVSQRETGARMRVGQRRRTELAYVTYPDCQKYRAERFGVRR